MSYAVGVPTVRARNSLIVLEGPASDIQILELPRQFSERHATTYPADDGVVNTSEVHEENRPGGNLANMPRKNKTLSARSATAGIRQGVAHQKYE